MLTQWFVFAIVVIALFALVSNTSPTGITAIENQIFLMNCPSPLNGAIATNLNIDGLTVTYDIVRDNSTGDYHLTLFDCAVTDPDIPLYSAGTTVLTTSNNWFAIGNSYLAYLMNLISETGFKIQAFLTLVGFMLTPINFNILG